MACTVVQIDYNLSLMFRSMTWVSFVIKASSQGWNQAAHLSHFIIAAQCLAVKLSKCHVQHTPLIHTCQGDLQSCYTYHMPGTGSTVACIVLQGDLTFVVKVCVHMCISIHTHEKMLQMYSTCHTWS